MFEVKLMVDHPWTRENGCGMRGSVPNHAVGRLLHC